MKSVVHGDFHEMYSKGSVYRAKIFVIFVPCCFMKSIVHEDFQM